MDPLNSIRIFLEVAKQKGFAPAAKKLSISNSAASRNIQELEEWLNIELFHRTTRKLQLTEEGKIYISKCEDLLERTEELKSIHTRSKIKPEGIVRVTMPHWMAETYLCPKLPTFTEKYPQISIELDLIDQPINIEEENYDVSIGCGLSKLNNSGLVAKKIADDQLFLVASPSYLKKRGTPKTIKELKLHDCIIDEASPFSNQWPLKNSRKVVAVKGKIRVNSGQIAKKLVVDGLGISLLPKIFISRELEEGSLVPFFKNLINFKGHLYIIYKPARNQTSAAKLFVEFAHKCLENISYF
jgi:DNA-binding transcriptional LysR family regulator